jgi:hypothetical protein
LKTAVIYFSEGDAPPPSEDAPGAEAEEGEKAEEKPKAAEKPAATEQVECPCGTKNKPNYKFCRKCGLKNGDAPAAAKPAAAKPVEKKRAAPPPRQSLAEGELTEAEKKAWARKKILAAAAANKKSSGGEVACPSCKTMHKKAHHLVRVN